MKSLKLACGALVVLGFAGNAAAITGPKPEFKKMADDVYAYVGKLNDANALVIVTNEGVVLADTGNNTTDSREIMKDIQSVTRQPVRYVVITQNHGDHIGGTPLFSPPATVIVHDRVAKLWSEMKPYQINSWRKRFSERAEALKNVNPIDTVASFGDHMTLHLGGKEIQLLYVDDKYNPGDVAVWLPKEGVLHASFAGYKDRHPDIRPDYSHGTTEGMVKQLDAYIALKPKVIIPAHGPLAEVTDLETMVDYLELARQKVRVMMAKGLPLPEIERGFNMNEYKDWDRTEHLGWTADTIYRELKGEGPLDIRVAELRLNGVVMKALQDGRFVTVKTDEGKEVQLRISADTDVEGIADRTQLKAGMKVSALYQIPEGVNPALGYDALELTVAK